MRLITRESDYGISALVLLAKRRDTTTSAYNGFARVKCKDCGHEYLLPFSCKRRYFSPSCHQKRGMEFGE